MCCVYFEHRPSPICSVHWRWWLGWCSAGSTFIWWRHCMPLTPRDSSTALHRTARKSSSSAPQTPGSLSATAPAVGMCSSTWVKRFAQGTLYNTQYTIQNPWTMVLSTILSGSILTILPSSKVHRLFYRGIWRFKPIQFTISNTVTDICSQREISNGWESILKCT